MSGILAIVARDGPPVSLQSLRAPLLQFGGDGRADWTDGTAAMTVEWLRVRPREITAPLHIGPGGATVVVADARLDDRAGLLEQLRTAGIPLPAEASDAELLLAAYSAWGEHCAEHLIGDFAFAIWDAAARRLFCGRDHMGVRPLYFARLQAGGIAVASALDALRAHPQVSARLDQQAVTDFLIAGWPLDPDGTPFDDIRALAPGCTLTAEPDAFRIRRYWAPERGPDLHYPDPRDYGEHFRAVLADAVADRSAGGVTALMMSGGRDSVSIAATLRRVRPDERVVAFTTRYAWLMPDPDQAYAGMAARALKLEHRFLDTDHQRLFEAWRDPSFRTPEPTPLPIIGYEHQLHGAMAAEARVVLTGEGADAVLRESPSRLARLAAGGHLLSAAREAIQYVALHRRIPRPGIRTLLRGGRDRPPLPDWIRPGALRSFGMEERWRWLHRPLSGAIDSLTSPAWPHLLAVHHPPTSGVALETAHPFLDQRVIRFLLAVPPAQWYNDKGLLRMILRGSLPSAFLRRQKSWMYGEPLAARMKADGRQPWQPPVQLSPAVQPWVDAGCLPQWAGGSLPAPVDRAWLHFLPLCLSVWMDRSVSGL